MVKKKIVSKKKKNIKLSSWYLHVQTSPNNSIITLTDLKWNKYLWWWTWLAWFKWTKESTPFACEMLAKKILKDAKENFWLKELWIIFKWIWLWREWVFKAFNEIWWFELSFIKEKTPIQFWWCKRKRPKRN